MTFAQKPQRRRRTLRMTAALFVSTTATKAGVVGLTLILTAADQAS
jgi:hypothetical protein